MERGHKGARLDLTVQRAREVFSYNPETGDLHYSVQSGKRGTLGKAAGWVNRSGKTVRRKVRVDGTDYMAHRVIWLIVTGEWPEYEIDHIDGDGLNNRWENFRAATASENLRNRGPQINNTTGYKGTCFDKKRGKFVAGIKIHGVRKNLGSFDTVEEAYAAYCEAAAPMHGTFAKTV
jgi:hypothetical protein